MASAPPASHMRMYLRRAVATREARLSAVYDTQTATTNDSVTSHGLYEPFTM